MSKKVLKIAGRRPMLLALIIMATLAFGILFSGWLTPARVKAQEGAVQQAVQQETTNCEVASTSSSCVTAGSISLVAPTNSPVVCLGSSVSLSASYLVTTGQVLVTTTYTNAGNSGADACPDTYSTNYPTPTIVSNWWTASVGSYSTNGQGLTASFTPTDCGSGSVTFYLNYQNSAPCDTNVQSAGSVSGSFNVVDIQHQCVATTPTNQSRTTIGVGEQVNLTACGAPGTITWSTSAGSLSPTNGTYTTLTAPGNAATATVTVNYTSGSCATGFSVIEPSGVNMVTNGLRHVINRPDIGFHALIYVAPDSVNFGAVSCIEVTNNAVCSGVYTPFNGYPHDAHPASFPLSSTVVSGLGTSAGAVEDNIYSGDPGTASPFAPGSIVYTIPWQFQVGTNAWKTFTTLTHNCSLGSGGVLNASKAGASWSCNVTSATVSYPGQP